MVLQRVLRRPDRKSFVTSSDQRIRHYLPAVILLFFLVFVGATTGTFRTLESAAYSLGMELSAPRRASERFAVVMLDTTTRESIGEWPWSGPQMAELIDALEREQVRGVAWDLPLLSPVTPETIAALDAIAEQLPSTAADLYAELRDRILPNAALAEAFAERDVILAIPKAELADETTAEALTRRRLDYVSGDSPPPGVPTDMVPPRVLLADLLKGWGDTATPDPFAPAELDPVLLEASAGVGLRPELDAYDRFPLGQMVNGQLLPSLPLRMAMLATDGGAASAWWRAGEGIALNGHWIATDPQGYSLPYFYPLEGSAAVPRHSMSDLLAGALPDNALQGRVVLLTADRHGLVSTPRLSRVPEGIALMQVAASLYSGDVYSSPWWVLPARMLAWLAVAAWLLLMVTRLDWRWASLGTVVIAVVLVNVELLLLISQSWWLPLAAPVLALLVGHGVMQVQRWWLEGEELQREQLTAANLELGRERRARGHLDPAFDALRSCDPNPAVLEQLNDLAHDYERRQYFAKALKVFKHIKRIAPQTPEVDHRINRLQRLEEQSLRHRKDPIDLEAGETRDPHSAPMLGRFSILAEIARGSMGVVYRGQDSRIGRDVAVKTLALQNEFSGENLEEVQARFFREAEAAGRLSHPNIVTIYDVGEEDGLAYIAMDLLKGPSLADHAKPDKLLPIERVVRLGAIAADALHAAHQQNVIHRDIKPANLVLTDDDTELKVTDFGVAHLADASQTRTGTILGSPSFMSPEQVSGKRLDGRSDLWSLGVSLYQLLSGRLPFTGEPLGTLMYHIANEAPTPVLEWRGDLPDCVVDVLDKAMQKDPEKRYQTGRGMALALRRCLEKL
jgi:serine/threonine-protein kinase